VTVGLSGLHFVPVQFVVVTGMGICQQSLNEIRKTYFMVEQGEKFLVNTANSGCISLFLT